MFSDGIVTRVLAALVAGLVFGIGLVISGMSNPQKVLNFLDITGTWDPSLIFVMGGAMVTTLVGYRFLFKRRGPLFDTHFHKPTATEIDKRLLGGAIVFGVGWGLSGFCPGPAWTAVPLMASGTLVFVPAMLISMWLTSSYLSSKESP